MIRALWVAAMLCLTLGSDAFAQDFIEVKGRGVFDGRIVSENDEEVRFQNADGKVETFARSEILLLERGLTEEALRPSAGPPAQPRATTAAGAPQAPADLSGVLRLAREQMAERDRARAASGAIETRINLWIEGAHKMQTSFFIRDTDELMRRLEGSFDDFGSRGGGGLPPAGIAAIILMIIAGVALAVFGLKLLIQTFQQGFGWGLLALANGLFPQFALRMGEWAILAAHLMGLAMTYFILTHFRELRRTLLYSILCVNLLLLGLVLLRSA